MDDDKVTGLVELGDLIHGIARQLRPPSDLVPGVCTPVEITVMRFISENPGTSAGAASEATMLPSSNFSRVLRGLENKGLVRRDVDRRDARSVQLFSTPLAEENVRRLRNAWKESLEGILEEGETTDYVNDILRQIEAGLVAKRQNSGS